MASIDLAAQPRRLARLLGGEPRNSAMSAPATKAFSPAPVSTTARTAASCAISRATPQQLLVGRRVQGVQHLGTGDRDDGDGAVALDLDCHGWTLLAHRWAAIGPAQLYLTYAHGRSGREAVIAPGSRTCVGGRVAAAGASRGRSRRQRLPPAPPSRHPRPGGARLVPGGGRVCRGLFRRRRTGPRPLWATIAAGGRVNFLLAHPANYPHRASTSHSRPLAARFDRPAAYCDGRDNQACSIR